MLTAEAQTDLALVTTEAQDLLELVRDTVEGDADLARTVMTDAALKHKELDDKRTAITKPILAGKRKVDELFAPALKAYKTVEIIARAALKKEIARLREVQPVALVEAATPEAVVAAVATTAVIGKTRRVPRLMIRRREIIPAVFWVVDEAAVYEALKNGFEVPGAELWYEEIPVRE